MLQPGEVGVAGGRRAVLPAGVVIADAGIPLLHVEGRIGHDVIGAQVRVLVIGKGVGWFLAEVEVDAPDHHVHGGQPPGGGVVLLAVDRDIAELAAMLFDETSRSGQKSRRSPWPDHRRALGKGCSISTIKDNDGFGGVILATLFAFGQGELAEEIFVDMAKDVLGVQGLMGKGDRGDQVDQLDELGLVDLQAGVCLLSTPLSLGFSFSMASSASSISRPTLRKV